MVMEDGEQYLPIYQASNAPGIFEMNEEFMRNNTS
jgi:hypothetical protein